MSKLFMRGTRLETSEVMMMSIPNFNKSSDTTYLMKNTQKQIAQSGKCRYCTAFTKTRTCKHDCCPYMMQRIHMGSVSYETVMNDCFRDVTTRGMKKRLEALVQHFDGRMFWSDEHKYLFNSMLREVNLVYDTPNFDYVATLYMLTTSSKLWNQIKDEVYLNGIDFKKMKIKDLGVDSYAFYQAAKTIYTNEIKIEDKEMADNRIISSDALKIMAHGKFVEKYGAEILKVNFNIR